MSQYVSSNEEKKIKKGLLFYKTHLDIFTGDVLTMIINGIIR